MSSNSPPPSYSPPRPPPPYENDNSRRENTIKVSPVPFMPLAPSPSSSASSADYHHHAVTSIPTTSTAPPQQMDASRLGQPQVDRPPIIVYQTTQPAVAVTSAPYHAFCPKCQVNGEMLESKKVKHRIKLNAMSARRKLQQITTKQAFVTGTFTWLVCLIILFFFFPLACIPFCLDSCKDVHHYCPKCATLISIKKRFI